MTIEADWEEGFSHLKQYKDRFGNCMVPKDYKEAGGYKLGKWAITQRSRESTLSIERRLRLDGLGFVWHTRQADWEKGFSHLKQYKDRFGNCLVRQGYKEADGYKLGQCVSKQRVRKSTPSSERQRRLDGLGFVWNKREADWEEGFSHLKQYKDWFGNCLVPKEYKEADGYRLGGWVHRQRRYKSTLSSERRRRLDDLGFTWKVGWAHPH